MKNSFSEQVPRLIGRGLIEATCMLKPDKDEAKKKTHPKMDAEKREAYARAVAEKWRGENVRAAADCCEVAG